MQNTSGNAVPEHQGDTASYYSYSESEDRDNDSEQLPTPGRGQLSQQHQQHQQPRQLQGPAAVAAAMPQYSPVSVENTPVGKDAKKAEKRADKRAKKESKKQKVGQREVMEEGGNEEEGAEGGRKRGARLALPGAAKVRAVAALATTTANADTQRITIYLIFFYAFWHLLFIILSCVLSQLDVSGGGCYTFWGFKANCDSTSYSIRSSLLPNAQLKQSLQAGAAMSILQVLTSAGVFLVAWLLVIHARAAIALQRKQKRALLANDAGDEEFHNLDAADGGEGTGNNTKKKSSSYIPIGTLKWVMAGVMGADLVLGLIAWAIIAGLYSTRPGEDKNAPRGMTYGVGFGLGITAWIVELLVLVALLILV